MQCDNGEIEVFLCPEEENASNPCSGASSSEEMTDTESEASPMKPLHQMSAIGGRAHPPSPPPRLDLDEESRSSDIGQIRNVLISASDDFGCVGQSLQLKTMDQDNGKQMIQHLVGKVTLAFACYGEGEKRTIRSPVSLPLGPAAVIHVNGLARLCITVAVPCGRHDQPSEEAEESEDPMLFSVLR